MHKDMEELQFLKQEIETRKSQMNKLNSIHGDNLKLNLQFNS